MHSSRPHRRVRLSPRVREQAARLCDFGACQPERGTFNYCEAAPALDISRESLAVKVAFCAWFEAHDAYVLALHRSGGCYGLDPDHERAVEALAAVMLREGYEPTERQIGEVRL